MPWKILVVLAFPIIIVSLFVLFYVAKPHSKKATVVLVDFVNNTGDTTFDHSLSRTLEKDLEGSTFPHILSEGEVRSELQLMNEPTAQPITEELARKICLRAGSKAIIVGSISKMSNSYSVHLSAAGCGTREIVADAQEQAATKEAVPEAFKVAAAQLRVKFLESR
ncbi:MAG: pknB 10 [Acidobacteriaceae bacterium]|nr:pknB 10 [Acidobacteriaceae bacterium]